MYEQLYGFKKKPFSIVPDPDFMFWGRPHQRAYAMLEYGLLNEAEFTAISGDVGCGKTTLIRHLLKFLAPHVNVGLVTSMTKSLQPGELIDWVLVAFGQDLADSPAALKYRQLFDFVSQQKFKRSLLIVDEAHNLSADGLEELRMLSNINADGRLHLQFLLVGQPELRTLIARPDLSQLQQRISAQFHLDPLGEEETVKYINHRLTVAGTDRSIFTLEACQAIHNASRGVPRMINLLCDTALVYGFSGDVDTIDEKLVAEVIADRKAHSGAQTAPVEVITPSSVAELKVRP